MTSISKETPFIAFGPEELSGPETHVGAMFACPHCGGQHPLESALDSEGNPTELLLFYRCKDTTYLAAIDGHLIPRYTA